MSSLKLNRQALPLDRCDDGAGESDPIRPTPEGMIFESCFLTKGLPEYDVISYVPRRFVSPERAVLPSLTIVASQLDRNEGRLKFFPEAAAFMKKHILLENNPDHRKTCRQSIQKATQGSLQPSRPSIRIEESRYGSETNLCLAVQCDRDCVDGEDSILPILPSFQFPEIVVAWKAFQEEENGSLICSIALSDFMLENASLHLDRGDRRLRDHALLRALPGKDWDTDLFTRDYLVGPVLSHIIYGRCVLITWLDEMCKTIVDLGLTARFLDARKAYVALERDRTVAQRDLFLQTVCPCEDCIEYVENRVGCERLLLPFESEIEQLKRLLWSDRGPESNYYARKAATRQIGDKATLPGYVLIAVHGRNGKG